MNSSEGNLEIIECARWAFSHEGFPNLKIFAIGDLSHDGRYARRNILLCKGADALEDGKPGIRSLAPEDHNLWDLARSNMDMLAACAVEPLMK